MPVKILIIKLGYSETLDPEIGKAPSLGDVLRTTSILWAVREKYSDANITWLVAENAELLLRGNSFIDRILVWDEFVPFQLMREKFDILINLEKIAGVCALADMIDAWTKYGFRFDSVKGIYHGYEKGLDFISYLANKKTNVDKGYWQQILIEMLGVTWKEQPYIMGYQPRTLVNCDIGFNYEVGSKWPLKALSMETWKILERQLSEQGYTVSWQTGNKNLYEYMDWINSCKVLITNDSLGLHIALAFKKKGIGLFGPTDPNEVYFYQGFKVIRSPIACKHMPCGSSKCHSGLHCMSHICANDIGHAVKEIFTPN